MVERLLSVNHKDRSWPDRGSSRMSGLATWFGEGERVTRGVQANARRSETQLMPGLRLDANSDGRRHADATVDWKDAHVFIHQRRRNHESRDKRVGRIVRYCCSHRLRKRSRLRQL